MDATYGQLIEPLRVAFHFGAPGWYVLGAGVLLLFLLLGWWSYRTRKRNRYRRKALTALAGCKGVYEMNMLLKQVAITVFPRTSVASLRDAAWIDFLNLTRRKTLFDKTDGRLITLSYAGADDRLLRDRFEGKTREWIKKHHT